MLRPFVTLYGQKLSWYSTKVRAYLLFKGIDFFEESPTLITYYWTIRRRFGDPAMPAVVLPDGEWLQDSSLIIERLETLYPTPSIAPENPVQRFLAGLLELWADEFWHVAAVHTRWSYPEQNYPLWEAEMGRGFAPWLPPVLQRALSRIPKKMMLDYLPQLGIVPKQIPLIEHWITRQLDALDAHFATMPYLFGSRPSIADFALFGPLDGHIYRDVSSRAALIDTRPHLHAWIQRLSVRKPQPWPGEFLSGDQIPPTLEPLLRDLLREMTHYLQGVLHEVNALSSGLKSGTRLPRFTAQVRFPFADGEQFRQGMPYALWMTQRLLDQSRALPEDESARLVATLKRYGGQDLLALVIPRLERRGLHAAVV